MWDVCCVILSFARSAGSYLTIHSLHFFPHAAARLLFPTPDRTALQRAYLDIVSKELYNFSDSPSSQEVRAFFGDL